MRTVSALVCALALAVAVPARGGGSLPARPPASPSPLALALRALARRFPGDLVAAPRGTFSARALSTFSRQPESATSTR